MEIRVILIRTFSPLQAQYRVLTARLARTTPRERMLLGALILGALVYAPIALIDWRTTQEDRYIEALADRSAAQLALSESRRAESQASERAAIQDMRSWGFEASNVAIAQVQIEQRLVEAVAGAGLTAPRITTDPEIEMIGATQWLGGEVQADLRWTPVFAFLEALTRWPEGFRVTQFRYEITTPAGFVSEDPNFVPAGRVVIGLAFPVTVPNPEPEA